MVCCFSPEATGASPCPTSSVGEAAVWPCACCTTAASVLSCPADGSSLPSHVSHNAGILSFHKVSRSDSGNYTCIASNRPQGEIRATVQLVVAGEGSVAGRGVSCWAALAWVAQKAVSGLVLSCVSQFVSALHAAWEGTCHCATVLAVLPGGSLAPFPGADSSFWPLCLQFTSPSSWSQSPQRCTRATQPCSSARQRGTPYHTSSGKGRTRFWIPASSCPGTQPPFQTDTWHSRTFPSIPHPCPV